ncbi:MAG TPA: hypothetical protein VF749_12455 [Candidatus Acidoferrum sp.]
MKLEYLSDGSPECPLIRFYDFEQSEARQLLQLVQSIVTGECQDIALHNETWVEPVAGCRLNLRLGTRNRGVRQAQPLRFECVLNPDGWSNLEGLLEPFSESDMSDFQWLTHDGKINLLISRNGQW